MSPSGRVRRVTQQAVAQSSCLAQRCLARLTGRSGQLIAASWCRASMTRGRSGADPDASWVVVG